MSQILVVTVPYGTTNLKNLVLRNNPRLSGRIALHLRKLTKLDVRNCGFAHVDLDNIAKSSTKLIILR